MSDEINEAAKKPKRVTADGTTVEKHPIGDQIRADDRDKANQRATQRNRGLAFARITPGGAV